MTDLIKAVQTQEPGSALVELIEIEYKDDDTLYFHSGLNDLTTVKFRERTHPYAQKEYVAIPLELTGLEKNADGASARPTLTIANVLNIFRGSLGDLTNKDLVGKRVVRRQTLQKYLVGEDGDTSPPIEFPVEKFIIDRIASEHKVSISFELASVMDLEGMVIPNRLVVGKYCNWIYQGATAEGGYKGACIWNKNSKWRRGNTDYTAYFNVDDEPIIRKSDLDDLNNNTGPAAWSNATTYIIDKWVTHSSGYWRSDVANTNSAPADENVNWQRIRTYTTWNSGLYTYNPDDLHKYVEFGNTIWRLVKTNTNNEPEVGSMYWVRGDLCGKLLSSCKCRFQFIPDKVNEPGATTEADAFPSSVKDTDVPMPFGGFPGSEKYR